MNNKLQAKDLINIGLFTVLYFVLGCCVAIPIGFVPIFLPMGLVFGLLGDLIMRSGGYTSATENAAGLRCVQPLDGGHLHSHVCYLSLFPHHR